MLLIALKHRNFILFLIMKFIHFVVVVASNTILLKKKTQNNKFQNKKWCRAINKKFKLIFNNILIKIIIKIY